MRGNGPLPETESEILAEAAEQLRRLLPRGWKLTYAPEPTGPAAPADPGGDARLTIRAPDGSSTTLLAEIKTGRSHSPERAVGELRRRAGETGIAVMLITPYVGPALRQLCETSGVNYLDLTGWVRLEAATPAIAIRSVGADRDPRPARQPAITRLSGSGAGRVIRLLLDDEMPAAVRDIARRAAVSPGTVSKVLRTLESEAIVTRGGSGGVHAVRKRHLVDRWVRDYSFLKTNAVGWYLAPRGISTVIDRLSRGGWGVVTGSLAAHYILPESTVPVAALGQLAVYVSRIPHSADELGLVPAERPAANVLLAQPYDLRLLTVQPGPEGRVPIVGPGQAVADLKTLPGRAPQQGEQLMDYLATTDEGWR